MKKTLYIIKNDIIITKSNLVGIANALEVAQPNNDKAKDIFYEILKNIKEKIMPLLQKGDSIGIVMKDIEGGGLMISPVILKRKYKIGEKVELIMNN